MAKWFYLVDGQEIGPLESAALKHLADSNRIRPDDKVRRSDSADWHEAKHVKGLFTESQSREPQSHGYAVGASPNKREVPTVPTSPEVEPRHYGGIRRLPYFGIVIVGLIVIPYVLAIIVTNVLGASTGSDSTPDTVWFVANLFISNFVLVVATYYRLKNIGMNPWGCLLILIPIVSLLILIRCLAYPEGYADTKKLDTVGKVIICTILGLFVLFVVALVALIMTH